MRRHTVKRHASILSFILSLAIHASLIAALIIVARRQPPPRLVLSGGSGAVGGISIGIVESAHDSNPSEIVMPTQEVVSAEPRVDVSLSANPSPVDGSALGSGASGTRLLTASLDQDAPLAGIGDDQPAGAPALGRSSISHGAPVLGDNGDGAGFGPPIASTHNRRPVYPVEARRLGYEGTVVLRFKVLPGGQVEQVHVATTSGYAILDQAAVETARTWRFENVNEPCLITHPVRFDLKRI